MCWWSLGSALQKITFKGELNKVSHGLIKIVLSSLAS